MTTSGSDNPGPGGECTAGASGTSPRKPGLEALSGTLATNLLIQGSAAVSGILAARLLGPDQRGSLAALILWPTVVAAVGILGTNWAAARAAASPGRNLGETAGAAIFLSLTLAALSVLAGWFAVPYLLSTRPSLIPLARLYLMCWVPLNYLGLNLLALDQGQGNFFRYNWTRALLSPTYLALVLIVWAAGQATVGGFALALAGGNAVAVAARAICVARERLRLRFSLRRAGALLREGWPFAVSALAILLSTELDRIIVVTCLEDRLVGLYVVAVSFAMIFRSVSTSLGTVTFARSAQTADAGELAGFVTQAFRRALLLGTATGGAAAIFAPLLIAPLYGTEFQAAAWPSVFLALGSILLAPAVCMDESLRGQGKPLYGVATRFAAAGVIAATATIFIPRWGITGMAMSALCGSVTQAIALSALGGRFFRVRLAALWIPGPSDARYLLSGAVRAAGQFIPQGSAGRDP